jgi:hypothetical protein
MKIASVALLVWLGNVNGFSFPSLILGGNGGSIEQVIPFAGPAVQGFDRLVQSYNDVVAAPASSAVVEAAGGGGTTSITGNYLDALSWTADPVLASSWNVLPANVDMYLTDLTSLAAASAHSNPDDYFNTLGHTFASSSTVLGDATITATAAAPSAPTAATTAAAATAAKPTVVASTTAATAAPVVKPAVTAATAAAAPAAPAVKVAATATAAAPVVKVAPPVMAAATAPPGATMAAAAPAVKVAAPAATAATVAAATPAAPPAATTMAAAAAAPAVKVAAPAVTAAAPVVKAAVAAPAAAMATAAPVVKAAAPVAAAAAAAPIVKTAAVASAPAAAAAMAAVATNPPPMPPNNMMNAFPAFINKAATAMGTDHPVQPRNFDISHPEQLSIADFADTTINAIQRIGNAVYQVLEATAHEPTIAWLGNKAQTAVATLVDSATHAVMVKVSQLGNDISHMEVQQLITTVVQMFVTVVNILYTIINSIITVATGQSTSEWAMAAGHALEKESGVLLAQASAFATDVSHASLIELASRIDHLSTDIVNLVAQSVGSSGTILANGIF